MATLSIRLPHSIVGGYNRFNLSIQYPTHRALRKIELRSANLLLAALGLIGLLAAQPPSPASERFEVASIRPVRANSGRPSLQFTPGGGLRAANVTLKMLIEMAYDIRSEQLSGGVAWTDSELYTIEANPPAGEPVSIEAKQPELTRKRLQALLAERFHLILRQEKTLESGYILIAEKKGHKMTVVDDPAAVRLRQVGRWEVRANGVEMSDFARFLSVHLHQTVEDRTGLQGAYAFHLKWTPELREGQSVNSFAGMPEESLIPAVEEQLGLRLERQKVAADRYRIEQAGRPAGN